MNNILFRIGAAALLAAVSFCSYAADKMLYASAVNSSGPLAVEVDSALVRPGLVRVYCRVYGQPHTSQRIDAVTLVRQDDLRSQATDIDGVDFKRWFQWEESGVVNLEIDFVALPVRGSAQVMRFSTPKGEAVVTFRLFLARKIADSRMKAEGPIMIEN